LGVVGTLKDSAYWLLVYLHSLTYWMYMVLERCASHLWVVSVIQYVFRVLFMVFVRSMKTSDFEHVLLITVFSSAQISNL
jgi:hypothetical protein